MYPSVRNEEKRNEEEGRKKRVEKSGCGRLLADIKNVKRDPRRFLGDREKEREREMDREMENDAYLQLSNETN